MSPKHWRALLAISFFSLPAAGYAACTDNGDGTFSCSGTSENTGNQVGLTVLDNSTADVVLNNTSVDKAVETLISNDPTLANTGPSHTVSLTGGSGEATINNTGVIQSARGYYTTTEDFGSFSVTYTEQNPTSILFTAAADGTLLNNGSTAGVDAAIYGDAGTSKLTINNTYLYDGMTGVNPRRGVIEGRGEFSAAIYGSMQQLVINNYNDISNASSPIFTGAADESYTAGHWAIASYGGATYTAPSVLDGTQYATVTSAGMTVINNHGMITGSLLVVDSDPLLKAAQALDSSLVLAYSASDVGPRDSVINNLGSIYGNIYLGSGNHVLNNGQILVEDGAATMYSNIYVDQSATAVTSVSGGVSTTEYLIAGGRTFTFNQMGQFGGSITINDVAESVNTINAYAGYTTGPSSGTSDPNFDITTNGLGSNVFNIYCGANESGCTASGNWIGLSELNAYGTTWNFSDSSQVIDVSGGTITLASNRVIFGGSMIADEVIVNGELRGILASGTDVVNQDSIGTITGHLVNNGSIVIRDATLTVNGDATFNSGSVLNLRINSAGNGGLSISGQGTFASDSTVVVSAKDYYFRTGDTFTIATNSSGDPIIIGPGAIVNLSSSDSTGDIILTARVGIPDYLNVTTAGNNAVNVLMNYSGSDSGLVALQQEIQALGAEDLKRAAERLRPEVNNSLVRMTLQHSDRVLGLVESHLFDTYLAQVKGEPRVPVDGKLPSGAGIWFQGFGGIGTQDTRNNVDGYTGTSTGMAAGMDRLVGSSDTLRAGFAGAYAYGNIDNRGYTDAHRTNVNSYMGLVYGAWNADPWYVNGALGLARNTYATERIALGQSAEANHESWQFSAKVDAGWPLMVNDLLTVVPIGMLSYNRINEDGYTEKGRDYDVSGATYYTPGEMTSTDSAINLRIGRKTYDSYRAGFGGKVLLNIQQPDYNAGVELRAQFVREFGDLTNNSVAQFTHGGPVFYSPGIRPARDTLVLGSSVRLTGSDANDQLTLLASLDAELREQYFGQAMTLMLRYDFDQGPSYEKKASYRKAAALVRQQATRAVQATDRDIARLSQAMTAKNTDLMDELLAADLKSTDPAVRADAEKRQAVKVAIDNWINAMLNGNSQVYFNSYAADYVNEEGLTRSQWEQKRRRELKEGANTAMHIADLTIEVENNKVYGIFTQTQMVASQPQTVRKAVALQERNGRWLIVSEERIAMSR
ncbi:autotransporter outer membrane beta-barrel domain-containing protein [Methylovorus mays]|uniref:autotransporter outer membrane beta-barrel domain-containing protein n=1 Tax=Methylovorus mays TaxID=184077 RepID=UPI001E5C8584|nr:autotransporter outer membrane beta-barrel domain-containing protein [Methylovorus mays]MCB5206615.1 autotransporter domain-containing protein [Methylovorus mays]